MTLGAAVLVLLGGFLGGFARFAVSGLVGARVGELFPWGTLVVNVAGAFLIGLLAGLGSLAGGAFAGPLVRDFLIVGFCGGFTTVSSFALQTLFLGLDGEERAATLNIVVSAGLCLAAVAAGFWTAGAVAS